MRASVALRVGTPGWQDEAAFERLLGAIGAQGPSVGMADELALFTSITHTPVRIERYRELVPVARRRMERARARGLRAGLNILTTIGHHEEDLPRAPQGAFTFMTDLSGRVSRGSTCPNDPAWREYVRSLYLTIVDSGPEFIWIDDDVRLFEIGRAHV